MPNRPKAPDAPVDFSGRILSLRTSKAFERTLREFARSHAETDYYRMSRTEAARRLLGLGVAEWRKQHAGVLEDEEA